MTTNLTQLFQQEAVTYTPDTELTARIFQEIEIIQTKRNRNQKIIWISTFSMFFVLTLATGWSTLANLESSNAGNYFSIIFSDTSSALSIWKELSISILESLPIITIGFFLTSIYFLVWSARKYSFRSARFAY